MHTTKTHRIDDVAVGTPKEVYTQAGFERGEDGRRYYWIRFYDGKGKELYYSGHYRQAAEAVKQSCYWCDEHGCVVAGSDKDIPRKSK